MKLKRLRWLFDDLLCLAFGHVEDAENFGYAPDKPGWVDLYCERCQKKISTQPRIETSQKIRDILAEVEGELEDGE